jgi:Holliday junction DNA helicase RuvB
MIQQGFLEKTARGRLVTDKAYQHLGIVGPL